jgi:hypothetical protein
MNLSGTKTLKHPKTLNGTLETLVCTLYGDFNFYTLLDQNAYIKVVEYQKLNNFYIQRISSDVEQIGVNCKKTLKSTHVVNSEKSVLSSQVWGLVFLNP